MRSVRPFSHHRLRHAAACRLSVLTLILTGCPYFVLNFAVDEKAQRDFEALQHEFQLLKRNKEAFSSTMSSFLVRMLDQLTPFSPSKSGVKVRTRLCVCVRAVRAFRAGLVCCCCFAFSQLVMLPFTLSAGPEYARVCSVRIQTVSKSPAASSQLEETKVWPRLALILLDRCNLSSPSCAAV